jgi:hypothetical protein
MDARVQIVAVLATLLLLLVVLELVRRRRLLERYALLWLFSTLMLMGLALWRGLLERVAELVGIAYPPSALFLIGIGFILLLLLHFSIAVSRLSDQTKVLAQRLALLEDRQRTANGRPATFREHPVSPDALPPAPPNGDGTPQPFLEQTAGR